MRRLSRLWRNLTRKREVDEQLEAEVRSYLDLLTEEKIEAGVEPERARREARLELGGIEQVKERIRDVRLGRWFETLSSDLRHAWRMIRKMRLTAAVVVLSLGVGIGVNTTIFTWIQTVVFQPLPGVPEGGSFQHVETRSETGAYPGMSWLEYGDVRERTSSFRDLLAFRMAPFYVGEATQATRVYGQLVSGNYFSTLGLSPALGRFIQPEEVARPGSDPVAVISHEYWRTYLGSSPSVLGQTIRVNNQPLTIVGVAPERFQGTVLGLNFSLWTPATMAPVLFGGSPELTDRNLRGYSVIGRLRPHLTRATAQAELDGAMQQLARIYPDTNANLQAEVIPFWLAPRGPQRLLATSLGLLQGIMLLLLLAVCGNTANLMLARTSTRHREIGVRLAIGAGPRRVISLLLTENLLLALLGATLGVAIACWGTEALRAVPMIGAFPIKFQTQVDATSLSFAALLGLGCGLIFGIFPALQLARLDPQSAFRSGLGAMAPSRFRRALMGTEVALALMVLIVAGLFFKSFREIRSIDPGFRRDGILLAAYDFAAQRVDDSSARIFASRLMRQIRALPSVEAAAIATSVPLDIHGMPLRAFTVEGHAPTSKTPDQALTNRVTSGYFETMGIPFRAGGDFADLDNATAPPEAIVNEEFVRRYLEKAEPLGRRIESRGRRYLITGVVRNAVYESFGERPAPMIYLSYRDSAPTMGEIHIRTRAGAEMLLASDLRRITSELDPSLKIYDIRTLNEHVEKNAFLRRIPAQMFVVLGPLLLVLAAIGIYAVVAYSVAQRTTEIGVRLALGATAREVVKQIVGETLSVVYVGVAVGLFIAFVVDIHLNHGAVYLPVFIGVPTLLMLVAAAASWLPAHRASRVDPMIALRHE